MTTLRSTGAALAATLLLPLAACAEPVDGSPDIDPGADYAADELVLRVDYTGGFATPAMLATRLPALSVYGDGRVLSQGPQIAIYPGPALPNLQQQWVSTDQVDSMVAAALAAGVGEDPDLGAPPIADATATRFTVQTPEGPAVLEVYALNETAPDDPALTAEQQAARAALRALLDELHQLSEGAGSGDPGNTEPYRPTALAAVATPYVPAEEELLEQPELAWPGPELPGDVLDEGIGLHCLTVTGEELDEVLTAAQNASTLTPWVSGNELWQVTLRPLLPDETGCEDLADVS